MVEDEKRMAQALQEILRQEKYQVDHCDDGVEGAAARWWWMAAAIPPTGKVLLPSIALPTSRCMTLT